jgi:hypothetical protein
LKGNELSFARLIVPLLENEANPPPGIWDGEIVAEPELLKADDRTVIEPGELVADS